MNLFQTAFLTVASLMLSAFSSLLLAADPGDVALRGATIHTVSGDVISNGTLLVSSGRIKAVGSAETVQIPVGFEIVDVSGKVIIPGLVDSHSHLGVASRPHVPGNSDGNEMTGPVQSIVRAMDAINPFDPGIRMAQAGGVTTANIMPGSGNVIGGQTLYVKLRGRTLEEMQFNSDGVLGGLKMANGENPKRSYGGKNQAPMTRMKVAALQRAEFFKAREYMRKWQRHREKAADDKDAVPPELDLALEPLVEVLQGKRTVHFHTHRADDILTVLRLKNEFDFDLVIQHGTEGYKVLDQIAAAGVPVSMTIVDSPGGKAEVVDFIEACGAELTRAGVPIHVNTDDPVTESRFLLRTAAATLRGNLDPATALKAVTLYPAQAMRVDDRVGSLEPGKDADFVVLSGEPFSVYTRVLGTWIDGRQVFDLSDDHQRLYQTGGFALQSPERVPEMAVVPIRAAADPTLSVPSDGVLLAGPKDTEFVVVARRVHTVSGKAIENGVVVVKDGRILDIGSRELLQKYPFPQIHAIEVTPGLIDAHTVVPLSGEYNIAADQDGDEKTDPNQADVRVLDGFNPSEPLLQFLLEQGVTTVHATPGHANVIAGTSGVFHTHGNSVDAMTIRFPQALFFNLGEQPKSTYSGKAPGTRMGTASMIRAALQSARNYVAKQDKAADKDDDDGPALDLKQEALARLLRQEIPAVFAAHRTDDLQTALRIAKEFDIKPVLALATEGYLIADQLAAAKVPVIAHPPMQRVGGLETYNSFLGNAAVLSDAGIPVAICSSFEGYVPKTRVIRWEAAIGMVYGLGFDRALKTVTLDAARILGIDQDYGSIEKGKVADLVLYNGDPFEHATHVTKVVVNGRVVFDRQLRNRELLRIDRQQVSCPDPGCCVGF
jgi:imidazolonepropionase-like amidohydrolase